jgi:hypothetical protein
MRILVGRINEKPERFARNVQAFLLWTGAAFSAVFLYSFAEFIGCFFMTES